MMDMHADIHQFVGSRVGSREARTVHLVQAASQESVGIKGTEEGLGVVDLVKLDGQVVLRLFVKGTVRVDPGGTFIVAGNLRTESVDVHIDPSPLVPPSPATPKASSESGV